MADSPSLTIALTGATGMLGRVLVEQILGAGHAVRALARSRTGRVLPQRAGLTWVDGSLDDSSSLDALVDGADCILHAAYCDMNESPPEGRTAAAHFVQTNIVGTLGLLERTPATSSGQLVFVSSLAVYGHDPHGAASTSELALDEDFPVWPEEFYGAHKAALEKMVIAASGDPAMNTSVFRLGCVLGDYEDPRRDPLGRILDEAFADGVIRTQKGAWVLTAKDASRILCHALGDGSVRGGIFNTFDRWMDFAEVAGPLGQILGRKIEVECERTPCPQPAIRRDRLQEWWSDWQTEGGVRALIEAKIEQRDRSKDESNG